MNILFFTDSHFTAKNPSSRVDDIQETIKNKLTEIGEIIKSEAIDIVLHGGDMFHSPDVSNKFCGEIAQIFKSYNIPIYANVGNHDLFGYNLSTLDSTKLGLFEKTGVIKLITRNNPLVIDDNGFKIGIEAQEYYADIDKNPANDYRIDNLNVDLSILMVHSMLLDHKFFDGIPHTEIKDVNSYADIILAGHYHPGFKTQEIDGTTFINPGSLLRVDSSIGSFNYTPGVVKLTCDSGGTKYDFIELKSAKKAVDVFKTNSGNLNSSSSLNTLRSKMKNSSVINASIYDMLENLKTTDSNAEKIITKILDKMNEVSIEESVDTGYVESSDVVTITSVELTNFQAHENRKIDFTDGLNILTGSSNAGKSAILRAIGFVLYDKPSGSDFITTGKKKTKVVLTLSNGYSIERNRTKTSSGHYILRDPSGHELDFKGFSNNIPIEITNAHQLPEIKVNGSKFKINIQSQLDQPFLLGNTSTERISLIGSLVGSEKADATNKVLATEKRREGSNKKQLEQLIEEEKVKLEKFNSLDDLEKLASLAERAIGGLKIREDKVQKIKDIFNSYSKTANDLKVVKEKALNIPIINYALVDEYKELISTLEKLSLVNNQYNGTKENLGKTKALLKKSIDTGLASDSLLDLKEKVVKLEKLKSLKQGYDKLVESDFSFNYDLKSLNDKKDELIDLVSKLEELRSLQKSYNEDINYASAIKNKVTGVVNSIDNSNKMIAEIKARLEKEICGKECPLCGQVINNIESVVD